ncbi:hypothetical protein Sste5346_006072 [Sporothrix stenoceras]|uniref:NWD NACHT-NTPase N-terminal domain-containing protein n=1 Tax=Sporothrix stenoceras TaxID=5173 RepID=A0ABR3YZX2_9PEZI
MSGRRNKLLSLLRGKKGGGEGRPERPAPASAISSARASNDIRQGRPEDRVTVLAHHQESPVTQTPATQTPVTQTPSIQTLEAQIPAIQPPRAQSLWDRAYDALAKKDAELVKDYEKLLAKEEQANSASNPAQPMPPHDVSHGSDNLSRQARLNSVIEQGLQRIENAKGTYTIAGHEFVLTDQITNAAKLLLWAKDWIGDAVEASPQASVAWAGVCLVLPLLTNPTTASEANRDGFDYVTTRMRYYIALEPLLGQFSQNANVTKELMSEADNHIVDLYQHILDFQLYSVLRFYKSRAGTYLRDMICSKGWKKMIVDIKEREEFVNRDLSQMNGFVARQKLEALNKSSTDALEVMKGLLSFSTQQLAVSTQQLHVLQELQQDSLRQKLLDEQQKCLQLFYRTENENGATYDWYKGRVEDRLAGTCEWFLQHDSFKEWLEQDSGPLLVSADPGCGKSVLAKYLIDCELNHGASFG